MAVSKGYDEARRLRRPCIETVVLGAVCLADLVVTVALVQAGLAEEANPLMAYFMGYGMLAFCGAKLFFVVPPLAIAEWYRKYNDRMVRRTLRIVTVAYLAFWAIGVFALNVVSPGT